MAEIVRVRDYEQYCIVWYADGTKKTYAYQPEAVTDFFEFCHEKGLIYQVGQATEYARDPKFKTL